MMHLKQTGFIVLIAAALITGCSKKEHPEASNTGANNRAAETKPAVKKTVKMPTPKVITVDDRAASKTPDGRLYYDFGGKRYWRNYNDGKYYLFSKKMYNDPAFKPH